MSNKGCKKAQISRSKCKNHKCQEQMLQNIKWLLNYVRRGGILGSVKNDGGGGASVSKAAFKPFDNWNQRTQIVFWK